MNNRKKFAKKIVILQIIVLMLFTMFMNIIIGFDKTYAYTQNKKVGIDAFPDSYKSALQELANNHKNWTFTAYDTGMTWNEFMAGEKVDKRNTISSSNPLYKAPCGHNAGGSFYCASDSIIEYYADPRNFLTEDRNISIFRNVI